MGARHHIVPRFYLKRFAQGDSLLVRRRADGRSSTRNVRDLAVKDFYTFINTDNELDGSMEQLLGELEADTAALFRCLFNPFARPRLLTRDERQTLDTFVAFQHVRGARLRRETELLANYYVKVEASHLATDDDLLRLEVIPDPNEHIGNIGLLAAKVLEVISDRPTTIVTLDRPLFVTCDEPVLVMGDDDQHHLPSCTNDVADAPTEPRAGQVVHLRRTRQSSFATADAIVLPVDPRTAVMYGPPIAQTDPHVHLTSNEATEAAAEVLTYCLHNALDWLAANPSHPSFASAAFPPPQPLISVCDGGTVMGRELGDPMSRRLPRRRKR